MYLYRLVLGKRRKGYSTVVCTGGHHYLPAGARVQSLVVVNATQEPGKVVGRTEIFNSGLDPDPKPVS